MTDNLSAELKTEISQIERVAAKNKDTTNSIIAALFLTGAFEFMKPHADRDFMISGRISKPIGDIAIAHIIANNGNSVKLNYMKTSKAFIYRLVFSEAKFVTEAHNQIFNGVNLESKLNVTSEIVVNNAFEMICKTDIGKAIFFGMATSVNRIEIDKAIRFKAGLPIKFGELRLTRLKLNELHKVHYLMQPVSPTGRALIENPDKRDVHWRRRDGYVLALDRVMVEEILAFVYEMLKPALTGKGSTIRFDLSLTAKQLSESCFRYRRMMKEMTKRKDYVDRFLFIERGYDIYDNE